MAQTRTWTVGQRADEYGNVGLDEHELFQAAVEVNAILRRVGGIVAIAAKREEVAPGVWETTGLMYQWESTVVGQRLPEPEPPVSPEPEPVAA